MNDQLAPNPEGLPVRSLALAGFAVLLFSPVTRADRPVGRICTAVEIRCSSSPVRRANCPAVHANPGGVGRPAGSPTSGHGPWAARPTRALRKEHRDLDVDYSRRMVDMAYPTVRDEEAGERVKLARQKAAQAEDADRLEAAPVQDQILDGSAKFG